jgi:integrase
MSAPQKPPSYLKNSSPSGTYARTVIRWPGGRKEVRSLGVYGSPESHRAHERIISQWRAAWGLGIDPEAGSAAPPGSLTVEEVAARYWLHAEKRYPKRPGQDHGEIDNIRYALRALRRLYGPLPVEEFGPKNLKLLRQSLASGGWLTDTETKVRENRGKPLGMGRKALNQRVDHVRRMFRWAVGDELIPSELADRLDHVAPLTAGEHGVRETDDVPPVPEDDLAKTLPELPRILRAMVEVQLLTGARPGEITRLRPCDLIRSGEIDLGKGIRTKVGQCWAVVPKQHKTAWRSHKRIILIGPQAQQILAPFLKERPAEVPLFSPAEASADRGVKHKPRRKRPPGSQYGVRSYNRAVGRACKRAGVPVWHVNQLRHNAGTRLVEQFGWAIAQVVLGHSCERMTRVYALEDLKKAADALGKAG